MDSLLDLFPKEKTVRKLIDYVLLNACSVNSSGLYNGKAGMSLALFEAARLLKDPYIEEQAFDLLQEALLSKNEDIGFEDGLTGIGFSLLYLIKNKFIDADFKEVFLDNLDKITTTIKNWEKQNNTTQLFKNLRVVHFLDSLQEEYQSNVSIHFIGLFSNIAENILIKQFKELNHLENPLITANTLDSFKTYLEISHNCIYFTPSSILLEIYVNIFQKDRFASDFKIGHYLLATALRLSNNKTEEAAKKNIENAAKNIYPHVMSLSEKTSLLYLFSFYKERFSNQITLLENDFLSAHSEKKFEKSLVKSISSENFISSYHTGIVRFLIYWAYKQYHENQKDSKRFKNIF